MTSPPLSNIANLTTGSQVSPKPSPTHRRGILAAEGPPFPNPTFLSREVPDLYSRSVYNHNGDFDENMLAANQVQQNLAFAEDPLVFHAGDALQHEYNTRVRLGRPPFALANDSDFLIAAQYEALRPYTHNFVDANAPAHVNAPSTNPPSSQLTTQSATTRGRPRTRFSAADIEALVEVAVEHQPHTAPHGAKSKAWEKVAQALWNRGHFVGSSVGTIKNKLQQLIKYHENPDSSFCNDVRREIEGTATAIKLAALLDRLSESQKVAKKSSDDKKEKLRMKEEEDRVGGEAIRRASMRTLGPKRRRSNTFANSDDDSGSDTPERGTTTEPDSDAGQQIKSSNPRALKRTKVWKYSSGSLSNNSHASTGSDPKEILQLLKDSDQREKEQGERLLDAIAESTRVYKETSDRFLEVIRDIHHSSN
ncbi:hypothetical protein K435DRAFT_855301 [Dendrothele bispora CBS 962.96]|uniref:Uncharacterized protein n=1 Tax=Dendrothele bispora (strain CBS 962.96) TaxID=1314807 RepID=A0A4S8MBX6_DENBC|nr:hypothetical protein K435DRAFT_855301 [Dendrothele bispora CBS 962.96]